MARRGRRERRGGADRPVSGGFSARRTGRCAVCARLFEPGARIVMLAGSGACHEQCAPVYPAAAREGGPS